MVTISTTGIGRPFFRRYKELSSYSWLNYSAGFLLRRFYASDGKKPAKVGASGGTSGVGRKSFPVETDARRLQEYCCGSNVYVDGEDVKLKPENEYPDWLWTLHIGPPKTLDQIDPSTKEYWERVRLEHSWRQKALHKFRIKVLKKF